MNRPYRRKSPPISPLLSPAAAPTRSHPIPCKHDFSRLRRSRCHCFCTSIHDMDKGSARSSLFRRAHARSAMPAVVQHHANLTRFVVADNNLILSHIAKHIISRLCDFAFVAKNLPCPPICETLIAFILAECTGFFEISKMTDSHNFYS